MENFRSKSCREWGMQAERSNNGGGRKLGPISMQELRSYSANYSRALSSVQEQPPKPIQLGKEMKIKRSKSSGGFGSRSGRWSLNDPELQRKKRVAEYKAYAMEGKMKGSLKKSFRWIKDTYANVLHGWW
ncbi:hypothetical protein NMG60_11002421 [Bertholletia excelsa]